MVYLCSWLPHSPADRLAILDDWSSSRLESQDDPDLSAQCCEHKQNKVKVNMLFLCMVYVWLMVKCGFYKNCQYVKIPVVDIHIIDCFMQSVSILQWGSSDVLFSLFCMQSDNHWLKQPLFACLCIQWYSAICSLHCWFNYLPAVKVLAYTGPVESTPPPLNPVWLIVKL